MCVCVCEREREDIFHRITRIILDKRLIFCLTSMADKIINPRRMREGYGSHFVCVCVLLH